MIPVQLGKQIPASGGEGVLLLGASGLLGDSHLRDGACLANIILCLSADHRMNDLGLLDQRTQFSSMSPGTFSNSFTFLLTKTSPYARA